MVLCIWQVCLWTRSSNQMTAVACWVPTRSTDDACHSFLRIWLKAKRLDLESSAHTDEQQSSSCCLSKIYLTSLSWEISKTKDSWIIDWIYSCLLIFRWSMRSRVSNAWQPTQRRSVEEQGKYLTPICESRKRVPTLFSSYVLFIIAHSIKTFVPLSYEIFSFPD